VGAKEQRFPLIVSAVCKQYHCYFAGGLVILK
jgi:hypothetical protein